MRRNIRRSSTYISRSYIIAILRSIKLKLAIREAFRQSLYQLAPQHTPPITLGSNKKIIVRKGGMKWITFKKNQKRTRGLERAIRAYSTADAAVLTYYAWKGFSCPYDPSRPAVLRFRARSWLLLHAWNDTLPHYLLCNYRLKVNEIELTLDSKHQRFSTGKIVCLKSECNVFVQVSRLYNFRLRQEIFSSNSLE